ncbi:MAG: LLM class flavin-dependent oxidoreductase [Caldilineaceae bacterium]|nr:LLM class flavin-dependent oxidoreductase [Caldilineaceae bacterium]
MMKYGRHLRFGYCLNPTAADPKQPLRLAAMAESLGLDYVGIQNHPYNAAHYDPWTLLTAIGMGTSRVSLFTNMGGLSLQSPMRLAKAAASLDLLLDGRVEVGLSTGASSDPLAGASSEKRNDEDALAAMEEAMQVMRLMWSGERSVDFAGKFYPFAGLQPGPAPAHHIGLWLGANEPRASALAGRLADGWLADHYPVALPRDLVTLSQHIDDAADAAGREPSAIQRIWNIAGTIGREGRDTLFQGSAKQWSEWFADLAVDIGIDTFLLMEGENAEDQLQRFALEVVPYTRELMEQFPGRSVSYGLYRAYQGAKASGATRAEEATGNVDLVDETSMGSFPASDPPASNSFT